MTAEVAILNKSAIALASDSAVTISAGSNQEKIYDTADKLFELSCDHPIAVTINGDMNFMQAPLGVLVKKYRADCKGFNRVADAAESFLEFLAGFGSSSPEDIKVASITATVTPVFELINKRVADAFTKRILSAEYGDDENEDFQARINRIRTTLVSEQLQVLLTALQRADDASFVGEPPYEATERDINTVREAAADSFKGANQSQINMANEVGLLALRKAGTGPTNTGIIVAGFGSDDLFPTLVHFEVYGVVGDRLKLRRRELVDIDREGVRARVLPFAQREMVERFLYGLDDTISKDITKFYRQAVPSIRERILENLDMSPEDAAALHNEAMQAEKAFLDGSANDSFEAIRGQSQSEIEDMVEFMPKPEMARMAEALVNLTSIKRRVSHGLETVGGPIDVAVVSKAEGFVWVKRKHYFPSELNSRFFDRKRSELGR